MNRYIIILLLIILVGFTLRIAGFNFEYVFDSVSDENYANSCVLRMINNRTPIPNNCGSPYPALYTLINLPAILTGLLILLFQNSFNLEVVKQLIALYPSAATILFVRFFAVMAGTASIFLLYKITRNLFNSQSKGLIAAAFLAVSPLPVQLSHWGRAWTFVLFFTLLALYFAILIYKTGARRYYILNAISASSAFGVHYGGFFSIIFVFLAHFFSKNKNNKSPHPSTGYSGRWGDKSFYLNLCLTLFLSVLWLFLNWQGVFNFLFNPNEAVSQYYRGGGLSHYLSGLFYYFRDFAMFDPLIFLLFIAALIFNFRKFFGIRYSFLTLFSIFYLIGMILVDFGNKTRWAMPLIIFSIPIVADLLGDIRNKFKPRLFYAVLLIGLLLPSLFFSAVWDYILILPNTRFAAKAWVEKNIPPDSKILFLDTTLILPVSQQGASDLNEALAGARVANPRYLYLAQNGQRVMPGYRVINWGQFSANKQYSAWQQFDYYILSYTDEAQYRERIALMPPPEEVELIQQIRPFDAPGIHRSFREGRDAPLEYLKIIKDLKMTGPTIEIYQAKKPYDN